MAEKVERKTTAETGVAQDLLDAHYDAVDLANEEGRNDIGRAITPKVVAPVEDKAVKGPRAKADSTQPAAEGDEQKPEGE